MSLLTVSVGMPESSAVTEQVYKLYKAWKLRQKETEKQFQQSTGKKTTWLRQILFVAGKAAAEVGRHSRTRSSFLYVSK